MPIPRLTLAAAQAMIDSEVSQGRLVLFHGTGQPFAEFNEGSIGRGCDANSALGIHLTECCNAAATYADQASGGPFGPNHGVVLLVRVAATKAALESSLMGFHGNNGGYDIPAATKEDFAAARRRLLAEGFDAVVNDTDDDGPIWCVLDPTRLTILAAVEAKAIDDASWEDPGSPALLLPDGHDSATAFTSLSLDRLTRPDTVTA